MKIAYLLEDTELAGGVRVAVAHADVLTDRGHDVTLVTKGRPLNWRSSHAKWEYLSTFDELDAAPFHFVIGTFWTTLADTLRIAGRRGVHLVQGDEGSFTAYRHLQPRIHAAFRLPLPKITVSPHLVAISRAFYDDATYVGQIVDDCFYQPHAVSNETPRLLLAGPWEADFKGLDVGYEAVRRARQLGARFDLVRVSQWPPAPGEPSNLAAEFHVGLPSDEMARLYASCDAFLGPSRREEGFGLPAAEALAGGLPAVLSEIPSFLSWDPRPDYALFAPEGDGAAMGERLAELLSDAALRRRLVARGREVVEQFRAGRTGERLERWFAGRLRPRSAAP